MRGSWRITRIAGVDIDVHWSFSFIILWVLMQSHYENREFYNTVLFLAVILLAFGCMLLHELGHAMMALSLDVGVRKIILLTFGGVAQIQSTPEKPLYELLIASAGPLVNLAIAIILIPVLIILGGTELIDYILLSPFIILNDIMFSFFRQSNLTGLIVLLIVINAVLFAFNLIPVLPMDGGRILRTSLTLFFSYLRATQIVGSLGYIIAILFVIFAFRWGSPGLLVIAIFTLATTHSSAQWGG
jgi:Zn-dependent protease